MSALLTAFAETGLTTGKFRRYRTDVSPIEWWNGVSLAWEQYNAANIAQYGLAGTETGTGTCEYTCADPAPTVIGGFFFYKAAGANLAVSDLQDGQRWQDAAGPQSVNVKQVNDVVVIGDGTSGNEWGPA